MAPDVNEITIGGHSFKISPSASQSEWEDFCKKELEDLRAFLTYDLARKGLELFPESIKLKHVAAQALNKSCALDEAMRILEPLCRELQAKWEASGEPTGKQQDLEASVYEESFGLLASVYKTLWKRTERKEDALRCRKTYLQAFERTQRYWTGINVAAMSWLLGESGKAIRYADDVLNICEKELPKARGENLYWVLATMGEAHLLLGQKESAIEAYRKAVEPAAKNSWVESSLQQLMLLRDNRMDVPQELFDILRPPTVVVFAGHMIDQPSRSKPRFPPELENVVRKEIDRALTELDARIGYSSAACGSDILFIESMIERGAEVNIFLPFNREDFIETSVSHAGEKWVSRFKRALKSAQMVSTVTEERFLGDDPLFGFAGKIFQGYAFLRAHLLHTEPYLLTVWDGKPSRLVGGTATILRGWPKRSPRRIIRIDHVLEKNRACIQEDHRLSKGTPIGPQKKETPAHHGRRRIKTMLFADVVGYSKLLEENITAFVDSFLPKLAGELSSLKKRPQLITGKSPMINVQCQMIDDQ